ncbi:MAG TPA: carbohydrate-binding domain-containing protein [Thermoleophilaceae bacterium]|jgi:hypothetical protein
MRLGGRGARGLCLGIATALAVLPAPVAYAHHAGEHVPSPHDVEFEGESMSVPATVGDKPASSGAYLNSALRLKTNGTATKTVTTTRETVHVFVRTRGDWCNGDPAIKVEVGNQVVYEGTAGPAPVTGSSYAWIGRRASIPAGTHTVKVSFTNDVSLAPVCDRNVWVDAVSLVASPFSPTGWRNTPLASNAPIASNSAALRGELIDQIDDDRQSGSGAGAWVGFDRWTPPVYVVPFEQPKVNVIPDVRPELTEQWTGVPLPPDARVSQGSAATPEESDRSLILWQPSTDTLWEFVGLGKDGNGNWHGYYGGKMPKVSQHQGHWEGGSLDAGDQFGASATSLSMLAGLQRLKELQRGVIDHAIDFGVTTPRGARAFCWPAQRTDEGLSLDPNAIPAGTRFRLPAGLDLDAMPMHPYARMVAKAVQKYGMVARDSTGLPTLWAEDEFQTGEPGAYMAMWNADPSARPGGILDRFPWAQLEALAPVESGCETAPR